MSQLQIEQKDAQTEYEALQTEEAEFKEDFVTLETAKNDVKEKRKSLENLLLDLQKTQKDDDLKTQLSNLDNKQSLDKIKAKEKEIKELEKKKDSIKIKSKVDGIVSAIDIVAGETTTPNIRMAEIQITQKGYTVSFSVTSEQSKKVKKGDVAEILNIWDDSVSAVLSAIKNDTQNASSNNKILEFDVTGEVQSGMQLSLSVGERTAAYDLIVPSSAIREDSNGKYVLVIEEKSSPIGNRYIARKEEVEILAQDDTQVAISAAIDGYANIITTSTKTVQPGDYVRLVSGE